ncbi:MAG: ABC transporter ATP-binding protein [Sphingobacteriales bacterium]|nr:ABC transporter ATP-binding protein [Sphingobacteriales bacterium]
MQITLTNTGKRFNREWIFRHVDLVFHPAKAYAITGPNGSGKSTLLQVIAGATLHNEGQVSYLPQTNGASKNNDIEPYRYLAMAAPYLELIEEMTAKEMLEFHSQFKTLTLSNEEILEIVGLTKATDKQLRNFSSGMKQRLKLAQAFFSDTPVLLLDEPTTNLDADGIALYHSLIDNYSKNKMVIVSSNDPQEYDFCTEVIGIGKYKSV